MIGLPWPARLVRSTSLRLHDLKAAPCVARSTGSGRSMARWARLELATDGLEIRCSVLLSYHRFYQTTQLTSAGLALKGKAKRYAKYQVTSNKNFRGGGQPQTFLILVTCYLLLLLLAATCHLTNQPLTCFAAILRSPLLPIRGGSSAG
jgi:hypothetical protein